MIRHDTDDAQYRVGRQEYPALATVGNAHGTLIAPQWILTAAHVVEKWTPGSGAVVIVNGQERSVARVVLHDCWPGSGVPGVGTEYWVDLALLKLDAPVEGVAPIPALRTSDEAGRVATIVGDGATGDGLQGVTGRDHALRRAQNLIDVQDDTFLLLRFDAPPGGEALEGISGMGDSGGPALMMTEAGPRVAGVSSRNSSQGDDFCHYGTTDYYARVSTHIDWMDEAMSPDSRAGALRLLGDGGWPASRISDAAQDFFQALRVGDRDALEDFETRWRGEDASDARVSGWIRMLEGGALVEVESIVEINSTNLVVRASFTNTQRQFRFGFEMESTTRLRSIEVGRVRDGH